MRQRTIVAAIITPIAIFFIHLGGYYYLGLITVLLVITAWEYIKLLSIIDLKPAGPLIITGVILLTLSRFFFNFSYNSVLLTLLLFGTAAYYILQHERNIGNPATDFGATLSVLLYIGFLGPYLISLRILPDGKWWTFLVLPIVWFADSGAYLIGTHFGKHKLAARTSPHKTWEGYFGGILVGVLSGIGLTYFYQQVFSAGIDITLLEAAFLALIISAAIPLGDLTESMIKRQASSKDSGNLLPGHGGLFDKLDSQFWAAPIGYYLFLYLFHHLGYYELPKTNQKPGLRTCPSN